MKNRLKKFVTAIALFGALSALWAHAAVSVYADETERLSNSMDATSEVPALTNVLATKSGRASQGSVDADHPPVRIDQTGVHVGGANPVDINVPGFARHGSGRAVDVVAIVAIVSTFGMPVMIVTIAFYFKHRRNKMTHETLRAMVDKGMPVTPELVAQLKSGSSIPVFSNQTATSSGSKAGGSRSGLLPGLILAGIGTAFLIAGSGHSRGGWIVLFIGVAFLVVWLVEGKNQNNLQPPR